MLTSQQRNFSTVLVRSPLLAVRLVAVLPEDDQFKVRDMAKGCGARTDDEGNLPANGTQKVTVARSRAIFGLQPGVCRRTNSYIQIAAQLLEICGVGHDDEYRVTTPEHRTSGIN